MKTIRWFTRSNPGRSHLRIAIAGALVLTSAALAFVAVRPSSAAAPTYNINTLAGKIASLRGTAGLQIRFSAFIEQEAEEPAPGTLPGPLTTPITPTYVLSSPLDGTSILAPDVLVNQDTHAAPQNETAIAVDPNNPNRIVGGANDYVTRTWDCTVNVNGTPTPCSALGDGYSGTYYSNNGGSTWCCNSSPNSSYVPTTDPGQIGTLIPGVERLVGGIYDAGGDPALAFDSKGNVFYAGLGFNRTSAPNTVAVNKGTFGGGGNLTWGPPTFINQTTSPSTLNDKEWIAVDSHKGSAFQDRVYVTWTRFLFNASTGAYVESPIFFVYSTDGGAHFSVPISISGNVLYSQGSRPVVGPDGTLYVFWDGATRLATTDSTWMVKSIDGGVTWSSPVAVAPLIDSSPLRDTAFRVNSFPAAAVDPTNGDVYATWTTGNPGASTAVYSMSTNGGATWTAPALVFTPGSRTAVGYPVKVKGQTLISAPNPTGPIEDIFPAVSVGANGHVYLGAYRGTVVSPWQTCAQPASPTAVGRIDCLQLGNYINNTRLDYVVRDLSGSTNPVTTQHINTRYGFGGGFFGDYTDMAAGSNGNFHAFWTDSNNEQYVTWWYGFEFIPTLTHQQDVVTGSGNF
jgi:hypothetical protein